MRDGITGRDEMVKGDISAPVAISAATTLTSHQRNVLATIPASNANDYDITLPKLAEVEHGAIFSFRFVRAGGYSDGGVRVVSAGDEYFASKIVNDKATANTDNVVVMAIYGQYWLQLADVTT